MQSFNRKHRRRETWRDLKSFGVCFLAVITLVVGTFAVVFFRNQFDHRAPAQSTVAHSNYPSDYEP